MIVHTWMVGFPVNHPSDPAVIKLLNAICFQLLYVLYVLYHVYGGGMGGGGHIYSSPSSERIPVKDFIIIL